MIYIRHFFYLVCLDHKMKNGVVSDNLMQVTQPQIALANSKQIVQQIRGLKFESTQISLP